MPSPWQYQARLKYFSDPRGRKGGLSPIPLSRSIPSSLVMQWACIWLVEWKEKEVWSIRQGVIDQWSSVTFDISPIRTVLSRAKDGDLGSVFVGKTWEDMYLFWNADLKTNLSIERKILGQCWPGWDEGEGFCEYCTLIGLNVFVWGISFCGHKGAILNFFDVTNVHLFKGCTL